MPARKPILGFESRSAAMVALHEEGKTSVEIAAAINAALPPGARRVSTNAVTSVLSQAARTPQGQNRTVLVPNDVLLALRPEAERRGINVNQLVRDLLDAVASDGLVGAVLDDGGAA